MLTKLPFNQNIARCLRFEHLESRIYLSCVADSPALAQNDVARTTEAVNCFAFDLYQRFEQEQGNLFLSPLSIAMALGMTYAGAAGQTAAQMEEVLHLGSEPGIHDSFRLLLESLDGEDQKFDLELANALWPQEDFPFHEDYIRGIEADYGGQSQSLDYSNTVQAADIINSWVEEQTQGRIQDLVEPADLLDTVMVLTNSIYFNAFWADPFDPQYTRSRPFFREDGEVINVPMMLHQSDFRYTEFDGFEVLEMPYEDEETSMVFLLPANGSSTDDLSPETLILVSDWLDSSPEKTKCMDVMLPKFKTTVSSDLEKVLEDMGMPLAFGSGAEFTLMTDEPVFIDQVLHKAYLEVNEQGTEAAAATSVIIKICFAAGTPVLTPDGEKPIEEIKVGDHVLSRNEHNVDGEVEPKLVEETFERHGETVSLHVAGQIICTTNEHLFYVREQGWTPASELRAGDILATDNGQWKQVEKTVPTGESETVYNFRVADHHTYFVGSESWGFAVWTHNCYVAEFTANHPFHFFIRDNSTSAVLFMGRITDPLQTDNELNPRVATREPLLGDTDGDDDVDFGDFLTLAHNFGSTEAAWEDGDFDGNGKVEFADFLVLAENFGKSRQPIAAPTLSPTSQAAETLPPVTISASDDLFERFDDELSLGNLL